MKKSILVLLSILLSGCAISVGRYKDDRKLGIDRICAPCIEIRTEPKNIKPTNTNFSK